MARPFDPHKLSSPRIFLVRMLVFLIICALVAVILYRQILSAFLANPGLNALIIAVLLMLGLHIFFQRSKLGRAMRATAQDAEAARMMGVDVDRVIVTAFFLGSALAGAAALIFGLYYNFTSFIIGYTAGLRAFTAAVLGGIGSITGAMVGGVLIGLIESLGGHFLATRWADVIIFSILVLVLVFVPTGLFGRANPTRA